jgi:hypothetical protein
MVFTSAQKQEQREKRYVLGLCRDCPRPRLDQHVRCAECKKQQRQRNQRWKNEQRLACQEAGICWRCRREKDGPDLNYCTQCVERRKRQRRLQPSYGRKW